MNCVKGPGDHEWRRGLEIDVVLKEEVARWDWRIAVEETRQGRR